METWQSPVYCNSLENCRLRKGPVSSNLTVSTNFSRSVQWDVQVDNTRTRFESKLRILGVYMNEDLVYRLRKRAEIRRQIPSRKSVQENAPDRIADLLEEAADKIEQLESGQDGNAVDC